MAIQNSSLTGILPTSLPPSQPPAQVNTAMNAASGQSILPVNAKNSAAAMLTVSDTTCLSALDRLNGSSNEMASTDSTMTLRPARKKPPYTETASTASMPGHTGTDLPSWPLANNAFFKKSWPSMSSVAT